MRHDRLLAHELRRTVDVARSRHIIRLIRRRARPGENVVRTDVEQPDPALRGKACEDLRPRRIDEAAAGRLVLCLVHGGVCGRMEDGVRLSRLDDSTHDVLVRQRKELRGDAVYLVSARTKLLHAVIAELPRRSCDEDFHRNPSFLFHAYYPCFLSPCLLLLYHKGTAHGRRLFSIHYARLLLMVGMVSVMVVPSPSALVSAM